MPRRELNARQGDTLDKLLGAARDELDEVGHEVLTIRTVAARAGVSSATAYNYFASRDHLFAELFWRHLADAEPPRLTGRSSTRRLQQTTRHLAETIAERPGAGGGGDQEPARHRPCGRRAAAARSARCSPSGSARRSDEPVDPQVLETLLFAFSGALLQTGMGLFTYPELADRLDDVVAVIMKGNQ